MTPNVPARQQTSALDANPTPDFDRNAPLDLTNLSANSLRYLGGILAQSGYFKDASDPAKAAAKILFGRELGLTIGESLTDLHIIDGKPTVGATILAGLIARSGSVRFRAISEDDTECVLEWLQKIDGKWEVVGESSFTIDQARRAGLHTRHNWKAYPEDMLFARALTRGAKRYAGAALRGASLMTPEEAAEIPSEAEQREREIDPALNWKPGQLPPKQPPKEMDWEESTRTAIGDDQPTGIISVPPTMAPPPPRTVDWGPVVPVRPGITYDPNHEPELPHTLTGEGRPAWMDDPDVNPDAWQDYVASELAAGRPMPKPGDDPGDEPYIHPEQTSLVGDGTTDPPDKP